jgi:thiol:disulfide interchange protein DsbA
MHGKTFARFHVQKKPIDSLADMVAFAQENGVDATKVQAAWDSFSVQSRCREAKRLSNDYDIDETPEMAIAGRFVARASASTLITTDLLINRVRYRA